MISKRPIKICPSILSADFANLEAEIAQLDPSLVDCIHIDVMDGSFVPNISIGIPVIRSIKQVTNLPLDVHLMIEKPDRYLSKFKEAGADRITVHAEASLHLQRDLSEIRDLGAKAGVSLNPASPLSLIESVLENLDLILLMTVNPGFGGQSFIPQMKQKIKDCHEMIKNHDIDLQVDGGIKLSNIREIYESGANSFVAGSEIFQNPPYNEVIRRMKSLIGT